MTLDEAIAMELGALCRCRVIVGGAGGCPVIVRADAQREPLDGKVRAKV